MKYIEFSGFENLCLYSAEVIQGSELLWYVPGFSCLTLNGISRRVRMSKNIQKARKKMKSISEGEILSGIQTMNF